LKRQSRAPKFRALSEEQQRAYECCHKNDIIFLTGCAGSTKTYTAVAAAIDMGKRIVVSRPAIEACGEQLGFLPGTSSEKMKPFLHPLYDTVKEYAGDDYKMELDIVPLAYMRGRTFKHTVVILDEGQNATFEQLRLLLTRIGEGSKIIVCGDWDQSDIRNSALKQVANAMSGIKGIEHFHFSLSAAIARHPLIPEMLKAFNEIYTTSR